MTDTATIPEAGDLIYVGLSSLVINEDNVRTSYDPAGIKELAASIKAQGLLQSLTVQPLDDGRYLVIAGNRRTLAMRLIVEQEPDLAGSFEDIAAMSRPSTTTDGADVILAALVENLQREDLTPLEEAKGYARIIGLGWKNKDIAAAVGRSTGHVAKRLALLTLNPLWYPLIEAKHVTMEQAYNISQLEDQDSLLPDLDELEQAGGGYDWDYYSGWLTDTIERGLDAQRREAEAKKLLKKVAGLIPEGVAIMTSADPAAPRYATHDNVQSISLADLETLKLETGDTVVVYATSVGVYRPKAIQPAASVKVEIPEGVTPEEAQRIKDEARLAELAERDAQAKKERDKKKAKKDKGIANAVALVGGLKKADVMDLALDYALMRAKASLYANIQPTVCKILGVVPERKEMAGGKTAPDYLATIETYLKSDEGAGAWRPKIEVLMAIRLAEAIEFGHAAGQSADVAWAKAKGLPIA